MTPQTEAYLGNVNTFGPRSCYDEGKRAAETLFHDHHAQYDLDVKVARIFNTYGSRMHPDDGRVISTFIRQALAGEPMTVFGDGSQTRAFCYVDDLVDGLMRLMASPGDVFSPVNLGNPVDFTIAELALLVSEATGAKTGRVTCPCRRTTRASVDRTSALRKANSAGAPGCRLRTACAARSATCAGRCRKRRP